MSLVMTIATADYIVMSGDYRAVHADDSSQKLGGIQKVFKLNDRVIYGITGDLKEMISLNKYLTASSPDELNVEQAVELFSVYLKHRLTDDNEIQLRAHIAGLDADGNVTMAELSHDDAYNETIYVAPSEGVVSWRVMYSNINAEPFIDKRFAELSDYKPESVAKLLSEVNAEVAELDDFVSPECYVLGVIK